MLLNCKPAILENKLEVDIPVVFVGGVVFFFPSLKSSAVIQCLTDPEDLAAGTTKVELVKG